jgi:hypothetical protein
MVQEVHETYLHIYNNKYRGQTDKELGEQIILLINRHSYKWSPKRLIDQLLIYVGSRILVIVILNEQEN